MKKKSLTLPRPTTRAELRRENGYSKLERWWFVTRDGRLIRGLTWSDYEPCVLGGFPREFTLRLPPDDPRPLGRRVYHGKHWTQRQTLEMARHYAQYKIGVWYWPHEEPRPVPRYSDFTALAVVPPATLTLREERAA